MPQPATSSVHHSDKKPHHRSGAYKAQQNDSPKRHPNSSPLHRLQTSDLANDTQSGHPTSLSPQFHSGTPHSRSDTNVSLQNNTLSPPPRTDNSNQVCSPAHSIKHLRIFSEDDQSGAKKTVLQQDDAMFRLVASIINLALSMLETSVSRKAIRDIGMDVVDVLPRDSHIYEADSKDSMTMERWVKFFLQQLRVDFPPVELSNDVEGDGDFKRTNWAFDGGKQKKMEDWLPSHAGLLRINKQLVDNALVAANKIASQQDSNGLEQRAFAGLMLIAVITMAHELVHAWIGFLIGKNTPDTPSEVTILPELFNSQGPLGEIGESGRRWEHLVLGGIVEAWQSDASPLGMREAGILFVVDPRKHAHEIKEECIQGILNYRFTLPLVTERSMTTWKDLNKERVLMGTVRKHQLPLHLQQSRPRKSDISYKALAQYRKQSAYNISGTRFKLIKSIPHDPTKLLVKVV